VLNHTGNRNETMFLLRTVWGCILGLAEEDNWTDKQRNSWRELREIPAIKIDTGKL